MKSLLIFAALPVAALLMPRAGTLVAQHVDAIQKTQGITIKYRVAQAGQVAQDRTLTLSRPNYFKWDAPGLLVVSDGKMITTYDKVKKTFTQVEVSDATLKAALSHDEVWAWSAFFDKNLAEQVTSEKLGAEMNQKGVILKQVMVGRKAGTITLLIDSTSGIARGGTYTKDGNLVYVQVGEMTVSPKPLADSLFAWTAPEGATVATAEEPSTEPLVFADVKPIFVQNCAQCHSGPGARRNLDLTDYDSIMRSGTIQAGNPGESRLVQAISRGVMPPRNPLGQADIDKIKKWVSDGAKP